MRLLRVAVLSSGLAPSFLLRRTRRALALLGMPTEAVCVVADRLALVRALADGVRWFVRAGAAPGEVPEALSPSSTGRAVAAFGVPLVPIAATPSVPGITTRAAALLASSGGVVDDVVSDLPFVSILLCDRALDAVATTLASSDEDAPPDRLLVAAVARAQARVVRLAALDAHFGEAVRVAEIVTSLQIGGAEAIARTLAHGLPRVGVDARLFALGSPTRRRLVPLAGELDLGGSRLAPEARIARLVAEVAAWGADVVHLHLFGRDVVDAFAAADFLPVVTIHNARPGFPSGTASLGPGDAALVIACAHAVATDLRAAGVVAPMRTVPNGIDPTRFASADVVGRRRALRKAWAVADDAIVVFVVANPRPQKRLDRVAPILAATREAGRAVHLVWAGAASDRDPAAQGIAAALVGDLARVGVPLTSLGAIDDVADVLAGADVLLGTSDWEGLSLAHLEALAAGVPVVATDVGGTREIAAATAPDGITLVPAIHDVRDVAAQVIAAARRRTDAVATPDPFFDGSRFPSRFEHGAMVRAHARLLDTVARGSRITADPRRIVLVTANFSPGGAQSSARRLLGALAGRGHRVAAVALEEDYAHPTPGLAALRAAGIEVVAAARGRAEDAVADAYLRLRLTGRETFVFWNAIVEHKVLFAERAFAGRVFDVSPGEMYFASLDRYFARPRPDAVADARSYGALLHGAVVKFQAEEARARDVLGCPVHVVPNGVPVVERSAARRPGPFRFGTAVRIHAHKRLDLLIDAFRRVTAAVPEVELLVAGTADAGQDDVFAALRTAAADLPVRWVGFHDDVAPFLATLDGFVLVAEPAGCPNASLEAMGAGLPTIATDVGGIREQLGDGAGIVVPRVDAAALTDAMRAVACDPSLAARLAAAGRARVQQRFSVARMVTDYERILLER